MLSQSASHPNQSGAEEGSRALRGGGYDNGAWMKDEIGWWYRFEDGTYAAHAWMYAQYAGKWDWYYFDEAGYMRTGWLLNNGHWY